MHDRNSHWIMTSCSNGQCSYTLDEASSEVFRLLAEEINITNDENGDLDELDFTVEESERVELDSDNGTETVETDSERTSSW